MTGYGKANIIKDETREYQVEIKSVNHRYLDVTVKMPKSISYLEEEIKKQITQKIKRGKIDVFVLFENNRQEEKEIKINKEIAKIYIEELKELAKQENLSSNIDVMEIAKFPDVLTIKNNEDEQLIRKEIIEVTKQAVENLMQMRKIEGEKMQKDILSRLEKIELKTNEISKLSTGLIDEYVVKLENRIKEILKTETVDKNRIAQEVVIYADKCSVEEEITRLKSHIQQFRDVFTTDEAIGKKLDFIMQEMNRETNTIGSKANSLEITNLVVDIKTELENIREQVQNIE